MAPVLLLRLFGVGEVRNIFKDPFFQCTSPQEGTKIKPVFRTEAIQEHQKLFLEIL